MGRSESGLQSAVLNYLHVVGISCWRQNNHAVPVLRYARGGAVFQGFRADKFRLKGIGDISGILPDGKRLEIEVKTQYGRQTKEQKEFQFLIERNKGIYILARSVDDVENGLKNYLTKEE